MHTLILLFGLLIGPGVCGVVFLLEFLFLLEIVVLGSYFICRFVVERGIHIVSECYCCSDSRSVETVHHLFLSSRPSDEIWAHFGGLCDVEVIS